MSVKEDRKKLSQEVIAAKAQVKALYEEIKANGDAATGEDRTKLNAMIEAGQVKQADLDRVIAIDEMDSAAIQSAGRKSNDEAPAQARKSWGQMVIESAEFKTNDRREMRPVAVPGGFKAIYNDTAATGGALVQTQRQPELVDIARQRPFSILDVINQSQTSADAVEYVVMDSRTNAAAPVVEYTAGNFGLKPESNMTFDLKTAPVKTIATWVAASRQILADAPRLRAMIDVELDYMIRNALETQVVSGNGTGANFTGILNTAGIQARVHQASGRGFDAADAPVVTIRRAITDITLAFYEATAVVMNPVDMEGVEVAEYNGNKFALSLDPVTRRIWRVPVVESNALPAGTALVGNMQLAATLWDRMATEIRVGEPGDFFLRNAVAVLAELRAAFAVVRPQAVEKVTGL